MTSTYAVVENSIVSNVIEWDGESEWAAPTGASVLPLANGTQCGVGWTYNGTSYSPPSES